MLLKRLIGEMLLKGLKYKVAKRKGLGAAGTVRTWRRASSIASSDSCQFLSELAKSDDFCSKETNFALRAVQCRANPA